jgi:cholesterol transport system auxiliary component
VSVAQRVRRPSSRPVVLLAALLAWPSCRSGPPSVDEYLLATRPPPSAPSASPRLPAIRVKPLVPRGFLDRKEIAWREGDVRAGAYHYRSWSEPPAELVTRRLIEALRARGAFEQVDGTAPRSAGPFTLSGELLGLHEATDEGGAHPRGVAELELAVEVSGADPERAPIRRTLHARAEVAASDESMEALVRALSDALERVLDELAPQVEAAAGR